MAKSILGEMIAKYRKENHLTQEELGNLALACLPLLCLFLLVNVLLLVMQKNVHKTFRLRY